MKEIGEKLKAAREEHGVSVDEAAEDLNLRASQIENIEKGNLKVFKDVFYLKSFIRSYAKYLGLDEEKVQDEFNNFLFEHTSKISLDDIMEAKKQKEKEELKKKKISSPYTKIYKQKRKKLPIVLGITVFVFFILIAILLIKNRTNQDIVNSELKESREYEYTDEAYFS